ncbi:SDR family NAD(P)-dependent oxidoreductase [Pseudomonas sp. NPDC089396]|jgi:NAD(P)-dependent dehydrogenase (short-subunit alcohol dehydrogenase family)|uniref:SDR family NAD(P)-dependent oxidoreductase n=1 Tax=Pseudomonas sp. NPDC089396 TaxID=3364461 RepID=UPI003832ED8B
MSRRLQGKIAFVTGAGSGIGAATARRFAEEGACVVLCGRNLAPLEAVAAVIRDAGGQAQACVADVSDEQAIVAAIEATAKHHGRLDILVNNAMAYSFGPVDSTSTQAWHSNFATTVDGTFWATRTAMALMKAQGGGGAIVNLASICGLFGTPWMAGYSAAKAAVINFSRSVASEGASSRIRCNVVVPGVIDTPATADMLANASTRHNTEKLIPLRRVGLAQEVANAILFLASDEASYITGACLPVDGGRGAELYTVLE